MVDDCALNGQHIGTVRREGPSQSIYSNKTLAMKLGVRQQDKHLVNAGATLIQGSWRWPVLRCRPLSVRSLAEGKWTIRPWVGHDVCLRTAPPHRRSAKSAWLQKNNWMATARPQVRATAARNAIPMPIWYLGELGSSVILTFRRMRGC